VLAQHAISRQWRACAAAHVASAAFALQSFGVRGRRESGSCYPVFVVDLLVKKSTHAFKNMADCVEHETEK